MTEAFLWFFVTIEKLVQGLNFSIPYGSRTVGFLDFIVLAFLLALVVRNFVHMAR